MKYLILLLALPLCAHDLYLMPKKFHVQPGEEFLISVHVGDSFPASEGTTDPRRIKTALVPGGELIPQDDFHILGRATHALVRSNTPGSHYAVIATEPRMLEIAPAKFESYLKEEGLDAIAGWRAEHGESSKTAHESYTKFAKALIVVGEPDASYAQPVGLEIEFVPEADPASLSPGAELPVRLLFRGKPAPGLQVESAWASGRDSSTRILGRTDANGRIRVPISQAGSWRLHAVAMERSPSPSQPSGEVSGRR